MNHHRGTLTAEIPRKRKERERDDFFLPPSFKKASNNHYAKDKQVQVQHPNTTSSKARPGWSNRLLAGYMAHEFLTQGTLLGQTFDPARAQAVPLSAESSMPPAPETAEASGGTPKKKSYAEVASLLKKEGAHIPGIVNPTQLARWIQM